jgi:hypothetical protein
MMTNDDKLRLDYEQAIGQFKLLADIRFKLLVFVPTISGATITLLTGQQQQNSGRTLVVGLLGFFVTLGIVIYQLHNTTFYDAAIHRAKGLEVLLNLPICTKGRNVGGLFTSALRERSNSSG